LFTMSLLATARLSSHLYSHSSARTPRSVTRLLPRQLDGKIDFDLFKRVLRKLGIGQKTLHQLEQNVRNHVVTVLAPEEAARARLGLSELLAPGSTPGADGLDFTDLLLREAGIGPLASVTPVAPHGTDTAATTECADTPARGLRVAAGMPLRSGDLVFVHHGDLAGGTCVFTAVTVAGCGARRTALTLMGFDTAAGIHSHGVDRVLRGLSSDDVTVVRPVPVL
jgi:hypothetical protein